jgi:hypothetical protein
MSRCLWGVRMRGYKTTLTTAMLLFALQPAALAAQVGSASAIKNQVNGVVGGNTRALSSGSEVYSDEVIRTGTGSIGEFVFIDSTKLSVGPTSEVKLDKFVYNPGGSNSSVVLNVTRGAFRFVTGTLDKRAYAIRTAYGTIGVRGTSLEGNVAVCTGSPQCGLMLKVVDGLAIVTLPNGQVITVEPGMMVTVSPEGVVTGPVPAPNTILDFASLDDPGTIYAYLPAALLGVLAAGGIAALIAAKKPASPN